MLKLLYAIRFMTVIPIPYRQDEDLKKIARSSRYFPLVGLLIGLLLYGLYYLLHLAELDLLAAVGVTLLWVMITGGLHLDGLADTADGIGGGQSIERRLEIMKDSRIGSFGALALISQILIKTALIYELPETIALPALLVSPMLGRTLMLFDFRLFSSARPGGMGDFFRQNGTWAEPITGTLFGHAVIWLLSGLTGIAAAGLSGLLILLYSLYLSRRLGGLTGDCYGSVIEITESLVLLLLLILPRIPAGMLP
ncbi:MAG: adenosylcobinamide-GDP ribazoletransferase [Spirochaetia bacterium]|nr:adenosylcobinamide-GDP ribazoletransferase [Spirochaetia bacterium]MCF7942109.1 adenosylcobinamide-GDP ribazoletransferase [Spirochaetia bacterium]